MRILVSRWVIGVGCLAALLSCKSPPAPERSAAGPSSPSAAPASPAGGDQAMSPEELVRALGGDAGARPLVLHVGPEAIFQRNHIPGARYVGMASTPEGLKALGTAVSAEPKDAPIVVYCGCCPWDRCPNVRPALRELSSLGFTRVKALYLPHNFQTDWAVKGLPVEK
ncbi:MAG: rhodanese-like domain-containing protein [Myxococcales bacterium]